MEHRPRAGDRVRRCGRAVQPRAQPVQGRPDDPRVIELADRQRRAFRPRPACWQWPGPASSSGSRRVTRSSSLDEDHALAADIGQVDEHQRPRWIVRSPGGSPVNPGPSRNTIGSRTASSSASCRTARTASGGSRSSNSSVTHSQRQSSHPRPRGKPPGRSRRLTGWPVPGRQRRGQRVRARRRAGARPPKADAQSRSWHPSADRSAGPGKRCPHRRPGRKRPGFPGRTRAAGGHDGHHRLPQRVEGQRRHGNQRLVTLYVLSRHPWRLLSHPGIRDNRVLRGGPRTAAPSLPPAVSLRSCARSRSSPRRGRGAACG